MGSAPVRAGLLVLHKTDMQNPHTAVEFEVKYYLTAPDRLRKRILALGAESSGRFFERNLCFDTSDDALRRSGRLLRLRQNQSARLTYKAPSAQALLEVKTYHETEVGVDDAGALAEIFRALDFRVAQTYEKWRESFVLQEAQLCLDEMPFGHFLEIEGPPNAIRHLAVQLGLKWSERILKDYLAIFEAVRASTAGACSAPTFAACSDMGPLPAAFWREMQAG